MAKAQAPVAGQPGFEKEVVNIEVVVSGPAPARLPLAFSPRRDIHLRLILLVSFANYQGVGALRVAPKRRGDNLVLTGRFGRVGNPRVSIPS